MKRATVDYYQPVAFVKKSAATFELYKFNLSKFSFNFFYQIKMQLHYIIFKLIDKLKKKIEYKSLTDVINKKIFRIN